MTDVDNLEQVNRAHAALDAAYEMAQLEHDGREGVYVSWVVADNVMRCLEALDPVQRERLLQQAPRDGLTWMADMIDAAWIVDFGYECGEAIAQQIESVLEGGLG